MLDKKLFSAYLRQQRQLSMPDFVLGKEFCTSELLKSGASKPIPASSPAKKSVIIPKKTSSPNSSRLSALRPVVQLIPESSGKKQAERIDSNDISGQSKREILGEALRTGCSSCHLAGTRKKFVFGSGNAEASIMIIGEAPGEEEDSQGLPFVGPAGQLLTSMLSAIKLDRNKDVFITNILKCRPPDNRNPESPEILACMPLLYKQISVIQPKAILLLGRIAAHALLGCNDSIAKLRSKVHDYKGIPAMVIYHPAALLRNAEYKRPAWEDLQKFQTLLGNSGIYGSSK